MKIFQALTLLLLGFDLGLSKELRFKSNGSFKIVQFSDLHFGEKESSDLRTQQMMEDILRWEQPDVGVVTGDVVSGYAWDGVTKGWAEGHYRKLNTPFQNADIYFATTAGNHDQDGDLSRQELLALDTSLSMSLTQQNQIPESKHTFNYLLPIYDISGNTTLMRLWFLDSGHNGCLNSQGWDCVLPEQVKWFREQSSLVQADDVSFGKGFLFMHIPLPEYMTMQNAFGVRGTRGEPVSCSSVNTGLFSVIKETNAVGWVSCGHDHDNDYYGEYVGVTLGYGRKTGYGGYSNTGLQKGARVFEITLQPVYHVRTWIRQADRSIDWQDQVSQRSMFQSPYKNSLFHVIQSVFHFLLDVLLCLNISKILHGNSYPTASRYYSLCCRPFDNLWISLQALQNNFINLINLKIFACPLKNISTSNDKHSNQIQTTLLCNRQIKVLSVSPRILLLRFLAESLSIMICINSLISIWDTIDINNDLMHLQFQAPDSFSAGVSYHIQHLDNIY